MAIATDQALPRLLIGIGDRPMAELQCHLDVHWPLPDLRSWAPAQIIDLVENAGLRGHGGASFPTATKMRAVASRRRPKIVVTNGTPATSAPGWPQRTCPECDLPPSASASTARASAPA